MNVLQESFTNFEILGFPCNQFGKVSGKEEEVERTDLALGDMNTPLPLTLYKIKRKKNKGITERRK